jgi:IrrE N-terminal-like domain
MCKKFMLLWLSNGLRATASRVDVWRNKYANRTTRTETPRKRHWFSRNGSQDSDGRVTGQHEIGPGAVWQGGREGAGGDVDAGTPVGDCEGGGGSTVGVMARSIPDYSIVKREAASLLARYGYDQPPIDPVHIARQEGIGVKFVTFTGEYSRASGFFDPKENAIYVNKDEYPLRQTFTIAHELGHAKLHMDWVNSDSYHIFWRDPERNSNADPHEKEANAFAANLLLPRKILDKYYRSYSMETLSSLFAVSVPFIENRMSFEYGI